MHFLKNDVTADASVDGGRFISSCIELKCLGSTFVPKFSDTPDIIKQISQARKAFNAINKHVFSKRVLLT
jgi:hypothetical protein